MRRAPLGLFGALVLIALVERHVDKNPLDYLGGSHWSYRVASKVADAGSKGNRILVFGDSLLRLGLAPTAIEAETGLRGYNFAQAGGQAPGSYFLLRRAIASGAKPSAIVVDFFPRLLAENPSFNNDNWPFLADLGDGLGLAMISKKPELFARLVVRWALPSARSRISLRTNLQLALQPSPVSIKHEILKSIRNWKVNRGAEITASRPGLLENIDAWERGYFGTFHCSRINKAYVEKFLDLAKAHQIPVFWLLPPYQPDLQARCERSGFDARHEVFVREFQTRYPSLFVLDARRSSYQPEVFYDLHHLGREGATVLSADVGVSIRHQLGELGSQNRWIALPNYRARPDAVPLEDVDQSRALAWKEMQGGRVGNLLK